MPITVEAHSGYRQITLNRPERLNALTVEMGEALMGALAEAEADPGCRALLLTGAGRAFCAGQDLTAIVDATAGDIAALLDCYHPLIRRIRTLRLPVVCAVNGVAAGAGANLALACDIVLAAQSASFVQAFGKIALVPDCGGTWFLPRLVGSARARALALLAEPLAAARAAEWGLIWQVVEDAALLPEAQALAARLAGQSATALALTKQALETAETASLGQQLDLESNLQLEAASHADHREGVRAFLEKRPPRFNAG